MPPKPKPTNPWIAHVQDYVKKHPELNYRQAMGDAGCKAAYQEKKEKEGKA